MGGESPPASEEADVGFGSSTAGSTQLVGPTVFGRKGRPGTPSKTAPSITLEEYEESTETSGLLEDGLHPRSPSQTNAEPIKVSSPGLEQIVEKEEEEVDVSKEPRVGASAQQQTVGEKPPSTRYILLLICGHAMSASLLLVVNKWALQALPYIWVLTTLQFAPAVLIILISASLGFVKVDRLSLPRLAAFFPASGMFFITMTAGNAVVQHSNVDTFIVMRALVPMPSAFLETFALGEPCPRPASWAGLCVLLLGAVGYASVNRGITVKSQSWMLLFLVMMPVDGVLIKHLINSTKLSPWGLVLYQNLLAGGLGVLCTLCFELNGPGAMEDLTDKLLNGGFSTLCPVALSCILGVSLSFFQMQVRRYISSTAFMVLGVSNKLMALLINQLAMDANSSFISIGSVLLSIGGAVCFQQTVKGRGVSQAPQSTKPNMQSEGQGASFKAYFAMLVGLVWASYLNIAEKSKIS